MKVFDRIEKERLVDAWQKRMDPELATYGGREAAFSPAVQAQISPYGTTGTGLMPQYYQLHSILCGSEYTGWMDETASISKTCYIGDWSWLSKWRINGPDVIPCLERSTINGYKKFPVGRGRHIISVTPDGKMIGDGIAFREGEDQFLLTGGSMVAPGAMIQNEGFDVELEDLTAQLYNFHIQGPKSLELVNKLTGEDCSDLAFITFREVKIAGRDVRLYRGGMSGEIGFEIFGDSADGSYIWKAVVDAGEEFGIRQYGLRSLMLNHLQAFFPTIWVDFIPSVVPGAEALYRSPVDYGWGGLIDKTRDFPGKSVLVEEMANPVRKSVTLEYNNEDCIGVFASLFDTDQEPIRQFEMPVNVSACASGEAGALPILNREGKFIGLVTNRGYSYQFRKFLGLAVLPIGEAEIGNEVYIIHGDEGKRQTRIRATVAEVPYKKDARK